jgi:hypothetical protein
MTTLKSDRYDFGPADDRAETQHILMPLRAAAEIAHRELMREPVTFDLSRCIGLSAMALSMVMPIIVRQKATQEPRALEAAEINERLFKPAQTGRPPEMKGLYVRQAELRHAIELLEAAHTSFGPDGVLFSKSRDDGIAKATDGAGAERDRSADR